MKGEYLESIDNEEKIKSEIFRYVSFWPLILFSIIFFLFLSFLYLRYDNKLYRTQGVIEILDKSMDSEMALPTEMTIFNRSTINLENDIGRLSSYDLHSRVCYKLNSNVHYYNVGKIKESLLHFEKFKEIFQIDYKIDTDEIKTDYSYEIFLDDNGQMTITEESVIDEISKDYSFSTQNTYNTKNDLPFDIKLIGNLDNYEFANLFRIDLKRMSLVIQYFQNLTQFEQNQTNIKTGSFAMGSDQIIVSMDYINPKISEEYLFTLIDLFDKEGVYERQSEYRNTIDFINRRSEILSSEVQLIEKRREDFKRINKLTDIKADAQITISSQFEYDNDLFELQTQKDLVRILKQELSQNNDDFKLLPTDFGLKNESLSNLIMIYNDLLGQRDNLLSLGAGKQNTNLTNYEKRLTDLFQNIKKSIDNYFESLQANIQKYSQKESEFEDFYSNIPAKERILRGIERELGVKDAIYTLLIQKREEAAVNMAVIKPSIKVIEFPRTDANSVNMPFHLVVLLFLTVGLIIPILFLSIWFFIDNKIHTKDQLSTLLPDIPILAEIPFIKNLNEIKSISTADSRTAISESVRMLTANLNFTLVDNSGSKVILVTSSIKGEGKTLVSVNMASILKKENKKVILLGADLRNPQIHRYLDKKKTVKGISDYMHTDSDINEFILKSHNNLDIILSGTIPPNPTELLSSQKFKDLIIKLRKNYDYIIIDSAPCLLVSDTFEISKMADSVVYLVRANHSEIKITNYINEVFSNSRLPNINIVFNGVGSSSKYGYKYGYQYGYQYGYKYGYNYGYGYGYGEEN